MKGHPEVIAYLNSLVAGELAARDQYFIHSRMYLEWGYGKLYERINHEMDDETGHASQLIQRILMLEGTPDMVPEALVLGTDVPSMLQADLVNQAQLLLQPVRMVFLGVLELLHQHLAADVVLVLLAQGNALLQRITHAQLHLQVGLKNYLQSQAS